MSFRKPMRRITSDREEDDCLFNNFFLNLTTLLSLHQLACLRGLCEGWARVHACKPYTDRMYLCDFLKRKCNQAKKAGNTSMEYQNSYWLRLL
jgi:hypothetical protein